MYLKTCLVLSMFAALSAAGSCPAGFDINCCASFQTQSDARYLRGVDCEFAAITLIILRADVSLGVPNYQECPCPLSRNYRFCCVSHSFSIVYYDPDIVIKTPKFSKREKIFIRSQGAPGCGVAPTASTQCAQCTRTATLTTTKVLTTTSVYASTSVYAC